MARYLLGHGVQNNPRVSSDQISPGVRLILEGHPQSSRAAETVGGCRRPARAREFTRVFQLCQSFFPHRWAANFQQSQNAENVASQSGQERVGPWKTSYADLARSNRPGTYS